MKQKRPSIFHRAVLTLAIMMLMTTMARAAQDGNWTYHISGSECIIDGYTGSDKTTLTELTIPFSLGGISVTYINPSLQFSEFTNLQTLKFNKNSIIKEMPSMKNCTKLAHVNCVNNDGTTDVEDRLPSEIIKIPGECFQGTAITTIDLNNVTEVRSYAFRRCNNLSSVILGNIIAASLTLYDGAFSYIPNICVITCNLYLRKWSWQKIAYSPNLYVTCPDGGIGWCGDGGDSAQDFLYWTVDAGDYMTIACAGDGWYNYPDKQLINTHLWNDRAAAINFPVRSITLSQVYALGAEEFKGMTGVYEVTLNDGLTSIGASAFEGCTKLASITIPASVTSIGADAFKGCTALTKVTIEGNPTIAAGAFPSGVTVNLPSATAPTITTQPTDLNLTEGYESGNVLTVAASTVEGQTLSYQWYSNTANSATGGVAIDGATSASYTIPTGGAAGITYYYCIVTATMSPNGQTATTTTNVVAVTIASAGPTKYAIATDGKCEVYNANIWSGDTPLTEAPEGMELEIILKGDAQPASGKYFTGEYTVNGTSLGSDENSFNRFFTMPAEAVTIAALQADKTVLAFDFSAGNKQEMPSDGLILFNSDEQVTGRTYVAEGDYELIDFDGSGTADMKGYFDTTGDHYYVERLATADATGSYTFNYDEPTKQYSAITFYFPTITTNGGTTITTRMDGGYNVDVDDETLIGGVISLPDGTAVSLTSRRTLSAPSGSGDKTIDGQAAYLYTVCLPVDPKTSANVKYYELSGAEGTILLFNEVATPAKNTPYLVAVFSGANLDLGIGSATATNVNQTVTNTSGGDGYTLKGTLKGLTNAEAEGKLILQSGGRWGKVTSEKAAAYIPPMRGYVEGPASAARRMESSFGNGNATGIMNIRTVDADGSERWYDLNGRRIARPTTKGIYVSGGKKMMN